MLRRGKLGIYQIQNIHRAGNMDIAKPTILQPNVPGQGVVTKLKYLFAFRVVSSFPMRELLLNFQR